MKNPIYKPKGAALEYGELALNIYQGCPHRCSYCYVPAVLRIDREAFHGRVAPRPGIIEATRSQLEKSGMKGQTIFLCFTCDPYPVGHDSTTTREIIKLIKASGNHVRILTKGGFEAQRDFDLLDGNDWFGITWSGAGITDEPGAASPLQRCLNLLAAKRSAGLNTWVSCEPVINPDVITSTIIPINDIDVLKIGKLNHRPSSIDWAAFGREAEYLCQEHGRNYYIKEDLRKAMEVKS